MASRKKQFVLNAGSGALKQLVFAGVGFILMPYAIWRLGSEAYGVYQLAASALAFFMLLQLGMGPTLVRYYARSIAEKDTDTLQMVSSTAQCVLGGLGLIGMVVAIVLIPTFLAFYSVPSDMTFETSGLLVCMAIALLVNLLQIVPNGLLMGSSRHDLVNGADMACNLLRLGFIVAAFEVIGPSVLTLGVCILIPQLLRLMVSFFFASRVVGMNILFRPACVRTEILKSLLGFSSLNIVNSTAYSAVLQGPVLIIGKVLGEEAVTFYAPAVLIARTMRSVLGQVVTPLVPLASEAAAQKKNTLLGKWAVDISTFVAICGFAIVTIFWVFGEELIGLWLGHERAWTWMIIAVAVTGHSLLPTQGVNYWLALGGGDIKPTVISQVMLAVTVVTGVSIGMYFWSWGLMMVSVFTTICMCFRSIGLLAFAYSRQFNYDYSTYIYKVYIKPAVAFGLCLAVSWWLKSLVFSFSMVWASISLAILLILGYMVIGWLCVPVSIKRPIMQALTRKFRRPSNLADGDIGNV